MDVLIQFGGRTFRLDDRDGADLVVQQMRHGGYEAPLPMLTLAIMSRTGGHFCDVGANNGLYTVLACSAAPQVTAGAFEPYPPVLAVLNRNIALNGLEHRVRIFEVALSESDGTAPLFVPDPRHGLLETSCSLESSFKSEDGKQRVEVNKQRFDNFEALLPPIDLIKVDIEGHELGFFRGAMNALRHHRPIVFAEMLPASHRAFFEVTELLDQLQYEKFRLRPDMAIITPIIVVDHAAWNYAFVPREKLALFEVCCTSHGLDIFRPYRTVDA